MILGTVLSEAPAFCMSTIVLAGKPGVDHSKPGDPVHSAMIVYAEFELREHV